MDRNHIIIRTSIISIVVNVVLVAFKMAVGAITGSIAVIMDAVNNLADTLGSVLTIVGTKLASMKPDKKHPYGYGRIEYLTSVVIAAMILTAGITSLKESVGKILHPAAAEYTTVSLIIIAVAMVGRFLLGQYVKRTGEKIQAQTLIASGSDAFFDSILSLTTLIAALISMYFGISLEGYLGAVISVIILKSGLGVLLETMHDLIGERIDPELSAKIKEKVRSYDGVLGAYDLVLHDYGPGNHIGSVHVEVNNVMTAQEIHRLTRRIMKGVYEEFGIVITVGIYASVCCSEENRSMRARLEETLTAWPEVLQYHGFNLDPDYKLVTFDLVINFKADAADICSQVRTHMQEAYPDYSFDIAVDSDFSD